MLLTPSTFTLEHLSNLKFKELQKLSIMFNVNKRWAKKQELINNLLTIKHEKNIKQLENFIDHKINDKEWKDGSLVFQELKMGINDNNTNDRKLTFNVNKSHDMDSRSTYEIPQNQSCFFSEKDKKTYSRETYEVPLKNIIKDLKLPIISKENCKLPQKGQLLIDEISDNQQKLLNNVENEESKMNFFELSLSNNLKYDDPHKSSTKNLDSFCSPGKKTKFDCFKQSKMKILTTSCTNTIKGAKKGVADSKSSYSLLKISQKSINIKKSRLPTKCEKLKSPISLRNAEKNTSGLKLSSKSPNHNNTVPSKVPVFVKKKAKKLQTAGSQKENNKECEYKILNSKSKAADKNFMKKPNVSDVDLLSPTLSFNSKHQSFLPTGKTSLKKDKDMQKKTIVAKKMPDFNKIHQKQFEQMDSLQDYLKKKEERSRKLFGTPFQGSEQISNASSAIFRFQSPAKLDRSVKMNNNAKNFNMTNKVTVINKLPPSKLLIKMEEKDKNRSHINGVRTNKRFELQMKLRNVQRKSDLHFTTGF